jgi:hypothetical protein
MVFFLYIPVSKETQDTVHKLSRVCVMYRTPQTR